MSFLNHIINRYLIYYPIFFLKGHNLPLYINRYNKTQYLPDSVMSRIQMEKLKSIIAYSKKYVPFYMQEYSNIDDYTISSISDIEGIPFITKKDIIERANEFETSRPMYFKTKKTTGGSTGQPVTIIKSLNSLTCELAATWRAYSWAGIRIGDKQAKFWGVPLSHKERNRAKLIDKISNRKRFSAFSFNEDNLREYYYTLTKYKPDYLYGYVSMLTEFALYLQQSGLNPNLNLKCIITTSELLTSYHRNLLEKVFSTRVYNEYGCGEVGSIAHECEYGSMHVMSENLIIEVYDGNRRCEPEEVGEFVITELNNYAMPLIRYRLGDFGCISKAKCGCGRELLVIKDIHGRAYDILTNRYGEKFHGEFFMYILEAVQKKKMGISAFQVEQKGIDHLVIKIKTDKGYCNGTEQFITNNIREKFDKDVVIDFKLVNEIEREPSGKMRIIVGMK